MNAALTEEVRSWLSQRGLDRAFPIEWRMPEDEAHGDLALSLALKLGHLAKEDPRRIAEDLASRLRKHPDAHRCEVAGPGYVNVWLHPHALIRSLGLTEAALQPRPEVSEAPVIIEYSQPNVAKPLGVHHILSTVIGQALVNIHRHLGQRVVTINHIGDWGTQFGKLAVAMKTWGTKPASQCGIDDFLKLYVKFHEEAEKNPSLEDEARKQFLKLEKGDKELRAFWKTIVDVTMREMERTYARLHIAFDFVLGESFYEDKMQAVIVEGKKKKVFTEGEQGALIVSFSEESGLPPAIILKADGATIYLTRDLAAVRYRIETWHPSAILYVVDSAQTLHFRQLFTIAERMGWTSARLEHVVFGRMRFADAHMSTRKGNILKLEDVLTEAVEKADQVIGEHEGEIVTDDRPGLAEMMGTGAVVYGILSQNRKMDIIFDWKKILALEGNSAPYLQYTHARARSVLRKAETDRASLPENVRTFTPSERSIARILMQFPSVLEDSGLSRMPHTLANFLFALAQSFNAFYAASPILKAADKEQKALRLALTSLTANVLKTGAELLTLRLPDRM